MLHLLGYEAVTIDQIKRFRQLGSLTPGHPENFITPGVETTTGPLGQGLANAVGMAIAERHLAAEFGDDVVNHLTYVLASDGDLMEGISQEAIALAGHLQAEQADRAVRRQRHFHRRAAVACRQVDQVKRFEAAGWTATRIDGHDPDAIAPAIEQAQDIRPADDDRLQDHHRLRRADQGRQARSRHGSPLGADEIKGAREKLGWSEPAFQIPTDVLTSWRAAGQRSQSRAQGMGQAARGAAERQARRLRAPHARRPARHRSTPRCAR